MATNSALPATSFDGATRTFSGTPPQGVSGNIDITVTASDGALGASDTFRLVVDAINHAPAVANAISDQSVNEDAAWSFQFASNAFLDVDGDSLTYTATLRGDGLGLAGLADVQRRHADVLRHAAAELQWSH